MNMTSPIGAPGSENYRPSSKGITNYTLSSSILIAMCGWGAAEKLVPSPAKLAAEESSLAVVAAPSAQQGGAPEARASRKGRFPFAACGIPVGTELTLKGRPEIKATVTDDDRLEYEGVRLSVSELGRILRNWETSDGARHWLLEDGRSLADVRQSVWSREVRFVGPDGVEHRGIARCRKDVVRDRKDGKSVRYVVLAGSLIDPTVSGARLPRKVQALRAQVRLDENGCLLEDVAFKRVSPAAMFVSGRRNTKAYWMATRTRRPSRAQSGSEAVAPEEVKEDVRRASDSDQKTDADDKSVA